MHHVSPPINSDIIVSELLDSFSDKELSPYCLGAAINLMKDDGTPTPQRHTSFLAPLSSTELYNEAKSYGGALKDI